MLTAIVTMAGGLRLYGLGAQSFWFDELVTMEVVDRPLLEVLGQVAAREGTPPLYYSLLWGWTRLFGTGDAAVRGLSALAGVAVVVVAYSIACELGLTRHAARVAALLVASNPMLVWYSQEARAYSLFTLVGATSILALLRALRRDTRADHVLWAVCATAALSTHYFAFLLVAGEAAWLFIARRRRWRRHLMTVVAVGVVALGLLPLAIYQRSTNQQAWIEDWSLGFRVRAAGHYLLVGPAAPDDRLWIAAALLSALALLLLVLRGDAAHHRAGGLLAGLAASVALTPLVAAAAGADYFLDRNLVVVVVPVSILLAAGFGAPGATRAGTGAALCLGAICSAIVVQVASTASLQKADWRAVSDVVEASGGSALVLVDTDGYLGRPLLRYMDDARMLEAGETVATQEIDVVSLASPDATPRAPCSWWFGRACVHFLLGNGVPAPLARHFRLLDRRLAGQLVVSRYVATAGPVSLAATDLAGPAGTASALVVWLPGP